MRGTRLWQAAGSPLIQGRSRSYVPYRVDLLSSLLLCGVIVAVYDAIMAGVSPLSLDGIAQAAISAFSGVVYGAVPGLIAVWVMRGLNILRGWLIAGVVAAACAVVARMLLPF